MNTSNEILDSIELSHLLCKIEAQIKNIESGDAHTQIGNMMNFPLIPKIDYSDLRKEAIKELYGMLYKAFNLSGGRAKRESKKYPCQRQYRPPLPPAWIFAAV